MISQQDKSLLTQLTDKAKGIIYDKQKVLMIAKLVDSPAGGGPVKATLAVLSAVEVMQHIPPNIRPMLAVNVLMVILDLAERYTGTHMSEKVLVALINHVAQEAQKINDHPLAQQPAQQGAPQPQPQPPQGIVGAQMGAQ